MISASVIIIQGKMKQPLISIITVCMNSGKTIRETIESILRQTYPNYEYIIKDGGSKDDTIKIVSEYESRFGGKLHLIQSKDRNMYDAMNQGIGKCSGDIIGILNSDDYYSVDTLEKVAKFYIESETKDIVMIGNLARVDNEGRRVHTYCYTQEMVENKEAFGHPSMFASKSAYDKIGQYDSSLYLAADAEWQYRAYENTEVSIVLIPDVLNNMRAGGASDNFKHRWKWFRERTKIQIKYKKGFVIKILGRELFQVLVIDLKNLVPEKYQKKLYGIKKRIIR